LWENERGWKREKGRERERGFVRAKEEEKDDFEKERKREQKWFIFYIFQCSWLFLDTPVETWGYCGLLYLWPLFSTRSTDVEQIRFGKIMRSPRTLTGPPTLKHCKLQTTSGNYHSDQVSISATFYMRPFCTKVLCVAL